MLTPQQRLAAYEYAHILNMKSGQSSFVCVTLSHYCRRTISNRLYSVENDFPEFYAQKPSHLDYNDVWFSGINRNAERIAALEAAITLTKQTIEKC